MKVDWPLVSQFFGRIHAVACGVNAALWFGRDELIGGGIWAAAGVLQLALDVRGDLLRARDVASLRRNLEAAGAQMIGQAIYAGEIARKLRATRGEQERPT